MKLRRSLLNLVALEDRTVPAVTAGFVGPTLIIKGTPAGLVEFNHVAGGPTRFQLKDNGSVVGNYTLVGDVRIQVPSHNNDIRVDLNSTTGKGMLPTNLYIDLGGGYTGPNPANNSIDIFDSAAVPLGEIRGSVWVNNGNGRETVDLGMSRNLANPFTLNVDPIRIIGSVYATLKNNTDPFGDVLTLGPGSRIGTDLITRYVEAVNVGQQGPLGTAFANVNRNVVITSEPNNYVNANIYGIVGGSATVVGGTRDDTFLLAPTTVGVPGGGVVNGAVTAALGDGHDLGNIFTIDALSTVGSNCILASGVNPDVSPDNGDLFQLAGTILGPLTVTMGQGNNYLLMSGFVLGNCSVTGGNGINTTDDPFTFGQQAFTATVVGSLSVGFGSGDNTFDFNGTCYGPNFVYTGGNSTNEFTYNGVAGNPYLYVAFGSGDNSFTWVSNKVSGAFISAALGASTLYDDSAIAPILFPIRLSNIVP